MKCGEIHPDHPEVRCNDRSPLEEHIEHWGFIRTTRVEWPNEDYVEPAKRVHTVADDIKTQKDLNEFTKDIPDESQPKRDLTGSRRASQQAQDGAERSTDEEWRNQARTILRALASTKDEIVADDFWFAGLEATRENRALGPILTWGAREGLIEKTDKLRQSEIVTRHARPSTVWRSLVRHAHSS